MKIRKSSIYPIILSSVFLISSCHIQNQAYQPYQESPKEVQRQSVVVESLYALLLSSTNSSLSLLDLADNRIKFSFIFIYNYFIR